MALVLAFIFLSSTPTAAQPRTDYCALSGKTSSLVLIDRTSPYNTGGRDTQGAQVASGIDALFSSMTTGDRLSVATIERHRRLSMLVFDDCLPGCDAKAAPVPFLSNCPEATIAQRRKQFRRDLYAAVVPLLDNASDQTNSDITGTIYQLSSQHAFNRIYIYSDMLENSQALPWSRFSTASPAQNFAAAKQSGFIPSLRGAEVQIVGFGLSHTKNRPALTDDQDRNIREFWRLYFQASGMTATYKTAISP